MYEAVRTEALSFTAASGPHPPGSHLQDSTYHLRNETSDVEMNEAGRDTEELEELQVGASLLDEGDFIHDDEQRQSLPGEDGSERDTYARDFEALVGFLTSADSDGGRDDEIFERLAAKVKPQNVIGGTPNNSFTEHMHDRPELAGVSGTARRGSNRRS
jgi:hypothetical protein